MGNVESGDAGGKGNDVAAVYACECGAVETFGRQVVDDCSAESLFVGGYAVCKRGVAAQGR